MDFADCVRGRDRIPLQFNFIYFVTRLSAASSDLGDSVVSSGLLDLGRCQPQVHARPELAAAAPQRGSAPGEPSKAYNLNKQPPRF